MYLGSSLCLSVVMIVVAIIQGATITYGGRDAIDVVWELYFQFVEVTLAILVVSLTAFRTLFIGRRAKNSRTSTETPTQKKWYSNDCVRRIWKKMSIRSTSDTEGTAWSSEIPMSNRPPSTMIQPDRTFSDTRTLADKPSSTRRSPDHGGGLNGHPTVANVETNRTAFAGRPRIEPCLASSHGRRVLDMPMVYPAIETEPATDSRDLLGARNTKPRSQISAERRISYWQRMLANGIERAHTATILPGYPSRPQSIIRTESIISGYRSHSLSTISGYSPPRSASTRTPDQIVSPLGTSPERTSALETV